MSTETKPLRLVAAAAKAAVWLAADHDAYAVRNNYRVEDLEKFRDRPRNIRQTVRHHDLASFSAHVGRQRIENSVVFLAPVLDLTGKVLASAVIDYHHSDNTPEWGSYIIQFAPRIHWAYALLQEMQKPMPQPEFVEKLRKLGRQLHEWKHADLIELLRSLTVAVSGRVSNVVDDYTGSINYVVERTNRGVTERQDQSVPAKLSFWLPAVMGERPKLFECDFKFAVKDDKEKDTQTVMFSLRICDKENIEEDIVNGIGEVIESIGLPVYRGGIV